MNFQREFVGSPRYGELWDGKRSAAKCLSDAITNISAYVVVTAAANGMLMAANSDSMFTFQGGAWCVLHSCRI